MSRVCIILTYHALQVFSLLLLGWKTTLHRWEKKSYCMINRVHVIAPSHLSHQWRFLKQAIDGGAHIGREKIPPKSQHHNQRFWERRQTALSRNGGTDAGSAERARAIASQRR